MRKRSILILLLGIVLFFSMWLGLFASAQSTYAVVITQRHLVIHTFSVLTIAPTPTPTMVIPTPMPTPTIADRLHLPWLNDPLLLATSSTILASVISLVILIITKPWKKWKAWRQKRKERIRGERTLQDYVQEYQRKLRASISSISIVDDTTRSLDGPDSVYIKLRLHSGQKASYELNNELRRALEQKDPLDYFNASRSFRENYAKQSVVAEQILRTYKRCVIIGDPGSGKTTLLKHLVLEALDGKLPGTAIFPIYIALNDFALRGFSAQERSRSFEEEIINYVAADIYTRSGFPEENTRTYIREQLKKGQVLLLLDGLDETEVGLDETSQKLTQRRVVEGVEAMAGNFDTAYIVVTARKDGYQQLGGLSNQFAKVEVLDLGPDDIHEFVQKWFAQDLTKANDLNTKLDKNPRLASFAANPLLLSLIAALYEQRLDLPLRRADLYSECIAKLMGKTGTGHSSLRVRKFADWQKLHVLARVAWAFQVEGQRYLSQRRIIPLLNSTLPNVDLATHQAEEILSELDFDDGLLKAQSKDTYGFFHLTLQEYFAALWVAEEHRRDAASSDEQMLDELLKHINDARWEEVTLLYAGKTDNAAPLFKRLLNRDDFFATNINLAGRCLAADPMMELREEISKEVIENLLKILTDNKTYSLTREQTAGTLAELARTEANVRDELLKILKDKDSDEAVSTCIAVAFGEYGDAALVPLLLAILTNQDITIEVRDEIAYALGRLHNFGIISDLQNIIKNKNIDASIRTNAVSIIEALSEPTLTQELLILLKDIKEDKFVRGNAATALGKLGDHSVIPDLLSLLANPGTDWSISISIIVALEQLHDSTITDKLKPLLGETQIELAIRINIAGMLVEISDVARNTELLQLVNDTQLDAKIRARMVLAFGLRGDKSVISTLQKLLHSPTINQEIQQNILCALKMLGDQTVDAEVVQLLQQTLPLAADLRQPIIMQLGVTTQMKLLQDRNVDTTVRIDIIKSLARADVKDVSDVIKTLREFAEGKTARISTEMRRACITTLGVSADDIDTAQMLANLIYDAPLLKDDVQRALWTVSRKAGVRVVYNRLRDRVEIKKEIA